MRSLILILTLFPLVAHAENWVVYGGFGPVTYYMDRDSAKRNGDIATINTRHIANNGSTYSLHTFDCNRRVWITPSAGSYGIDKMGELQPVFDAACKKLYEFWK